jgi:hypothetical protein
MKHFSLSLLSVLALGSALVLVPGRLQAQAEPGATRSGGLQVGATFTFLKPDATGYLTPHSAPESTTLSLGASFYGNFDFTRNFGVAAEANFPTTRTPQDFLEKSYLIGGRYVYPIRRYRPYAKLLAGIGTTSFDGPVPYIVFPGTPGTYGVIAYGGGLDYILTRSINLRADLEAQHWGGYPGGAINPFMFSIGAAYRFH